ncbi:MAG: VanZ family protein [Candidatus Atribacteria bacterium]|nr:VanZ family protein [Spirochaetota bacterium]MBE3119630.1 VanZ family protein [Candidatus Atribacteria bacterium]
MSCAPERQKPRWICSRQASVVFLAIVLLAVLGLSLTPHPESVLGRLSLYDKAGHFAAYVVLSFFAMRSIGRRGALPLVLAVAACTALGGLIEIIQPLVGRRMELGDFLVDLGGSAIGAVIAAAIAAALSRVEKVP